jgi:hypothetical protein
MIYISSALHEYRNGTVMMMMIVYINHILSEESP